MKRLFLVDVSSMFFRAFYAIRPLSNQAGMPTNAVYGFLSMAVKLLREIRPDYMAFCFDRPEPSFRKEIDPRYKANRTEMPGDLVPQVPYIRKVSEALGIPCFDRSGFEADDIIGTLTRWGREHDLEIVIVSGDKDFGQLVQAFVSIYDTMKDIRYDEAGVLEKWGIEPAKMRDYLGLVGDSSDNVPGVRGIGPKGACKLLSEFGSIEDIYANLDKIANAGLRKKLEEGRDEAFLSKKLVTIEEHVPLDLHLEDLRLRPIHRDELTALLTELDFKSFIRTLLGEAPKTSSVPATQPPPVLAPVPASDVGGASAFVRAASPEMRAAVAASLATPLPSDPTPSMPSMAVESGAGLIDFGPIHEMRMSLAQIDEWLRPGSETWGFHTERGVLLAQGDTVTEIEGSWGELGDLLSRKHLRWKGFDLKEFWTAVKLATPVEAAGGGEPVVWDQMLAAYVIRAGAIDDVRKLFTLYNGAPLPELPSPGQLYLAHLSLERQLRRKLEKLKSESVLTEIEFPLVPVLYEMQQAGILIDRAALEAQSEDLAKDIVIVEKEILDEAGETFNISSPKQLGHILFEKLKLPTGKKTKTGFSTDTDVLAKLAPDYPICAKILNYRELTKLKSTYVDSLPALIRKETGRVHTTFNQAQTTTGRLSSTNPNLQNIPIRTERGARIRKAFIASPDHQLISADYSQIELRILAHITDDPGLKAAFEKQIDIHTATASEVFEVAIKDVTPEMRRKAKAVNFGLAYGQGTFGLAEALRIPRSEATHIITRYFERFAGVKRYMEDTVETAKKQGYVETIFGRRRYIDELSSSSPMVRKFGERAAINAPIQGAASDIVKKAMIEARNKVPARMLLQVHDELIFEAPNRDVEALLTQARAVMEGAVTLSVPLQVHAGAGRNWDEAHT
jgi:DNA polymerase-1